LKYLSTTPATQGDINCLSHLTIGCSHIVAVGGAGMELFKSHNDL
jgi:hypothetical protein